MHVGVVGCGYWGPNLVRNLSENRICTKLSICDLDPRKLDRLTLRYPAARTFETFDELIAQPDLHALMIATPLSSHYPLARQALERGLHIFVEKPFTGSSAQAEELIAIADARHLTIAVGHTFLFSPPVVKIREILDRKELGKIYYISSTRVNLGLHQKDISVVWDLAPHDLSVILYATGLKPRSIRTVGMKLMHPKVEDVAFVTLDCSGANAVIHVSWVDPLKVRRVSVVGTKQMLVYDDLDPLAKIQIYDKGVDNPPHYDTFGEFLCSYKYGDIHMPRLQEAEPLSVMCKHFLDCVENGKTPRSDGRSGLRMVKLLEASDQSIRLNGAEVEVRF